MSLERQQEDLELPRRHHERPLRRSIVTGCLLFVLAQCIVLSLVNYFSCRNMLLERYRVYIDTVLNIAASGLDVDELERCMEQGETSPRFQEMQLFLDGVRENADIHFLYVVVPLNDSPTDNMKNVIAAATAYEYRYEPEELVQLNQLTGDSYAPETARKYLSAYREDGVSFFEERSQWGDEYTGLLPLKNSAGERVAALCVDVDIRAIQSVQREKTLMNVALILGIGGVFLLIFLSWSSRNIIRPILQLSEGVAAYTRQTDLKRNPEELALQVPEIHTCNEVEDLARAVSELSRDIRDSAVKIVTTEQELARMYVLANKDGLTHVGNKNAYNNYMNELQQHMGEEGLAFAILVADANGLKDINDTCGHDKGDLYLKKICAVICETYSHSPVFRIGGDEFVVILRKRDYENRDALYEMASAAFRQSLHSAAAQPWERISAAMGMAVYYDRDDHSVEDVFKRADELMYRNKRAMKARSARNGSEET